MGHRVVVRRTLGPAANGRQLLTDLLGVLTSVQAEALTVRGDDGAEHSIRRSDIVAAKRVPPRPARYSEMIALERIADAAWPAPVREWMGDWILRAADGWTNRANSALPLGDPGLPLGAAVEACKSWYAQRSLTPRITVPLPVRRNVADVLTGLDWYAQPPVLVQTAGLTDVLAAVPMSGPPVDLLSEPSADLLRVVAARKASLPAAAHHVMTSVPAVRFAEVRHEGALLALARGAVVEGTLHIGLVEVADSARRRGLAQQVSRALAAWAADQGATRAVLQVEEENHPAVRLYAGLGFRTHHRYITYAWRGVP